MVEVRPVRNHGGIGWAVYNTVFRSNPYSDDRNLTMCLLDSPSGSRRLNHSRLMRMYRSSSQEIQTQLFIGHAQLLPLEVESCFFGGR